MNHKKTARTLYLGILIIFALSACKGLFDSEPENPFANEFTQIDITPSWSPDGRTIAYAHLPQDSLEQSNGGTPYQLWLIDVDGTNKRFLTLGNSSSWSPDGKNVVFSDGKVLIYNLNSQQTFVVESYFKTVEPAWSPDGARIAYTNSVCSGDTCGIWFSTPDGMNKSYQIKHGGWPSWSADGKLLFYTKGTRQIWAFNLKTNESEQISIGTPRSARRPSLSPDGRVLLWQNQTEGEPPQICTMDLETEEIIQLTDEGGTEPAWSPDGSMIVYSEFKPEGRIWIMNADGTNKRQLTY